MVVRHERAAAGRGGGRRRHRLVAALAARPGLQWPVAGHAGGHAAGELDRRLRDRGAGGAVRGQSGLVGDRAPVPDHRAAGRSHHLLHVLGRGRDAAAAPALEHGAAAYRPAPRWLAAAHGGGLRHGLRAAPLT
ncbi:UNVERIFIED_CONTAM: hypothetical protein NCL1_26133 [Trichonephila clavipes]